MAQKPVITLSGASVKIMRSYDYCHFEVTLSTVEDSPLSIFHHEDGSSEKISEIELTDVDELRKEAMRLVDKAVEQYSIAKKIAEGKLERQYMRTRIIREAKSAEETPESERTPAQRAALKALEDYNFYMQFEYDYEDDWDQEAWEAAQDAI